MSSIDEKSITHNGKEAYVTLMTITLTKLIKKRSERDDWAVVITHGVAIAKSVVKPINGYRVEWISQGM